MAHRIITTEDARGLSSVLSREELVADTSIATSGVLNLWEFLPGSRIPGSATPPPLLPDMNSIVPGEVQVFKWTVRAHVDATEGGEVLEFSDSDRPGFHSTPTLDVHTILSGTVVFRLDEEDVPMSAGDTVIIRGQSHAWANPSDEDAVILVTVIGAARQ